MPKPGLRAQPCELPVPGICAGVSLNPVLGALGTDPWLWAEESGPCCTGERLNKKAVFLSAVCIIITCFNKDVKLLQKTFTP